MVPTSLTVSYGVLVDSRSPLTLSELSRACHADPDELCALIDEGVITPIASVPSDWRFDSLALRRARAATRVMRDLAVDAASAALVLDLLDEIEQLKSQLRRLGER